MPSQYADIPAVASENWKNPVPTAADLPTYVNSLGDVRITIDTSVIYVWTGSSWSAEVGTSGVTSLNSLIGDLSILGGTGISVTPSGSGITIANTSLGNYLLKAGGAMTGAITLADYTTIVSPTEGQIAWNYTTHAFTTYDGSTWT